ncbi:phosphoribosylamine--glycine ligase [Rhodobacterales bacterium 52_120_T64]|nr:phosphoribosylamine--glycine ligase [Rhodobacterales bacterium 52_120_T64]
MNILILGGGGREHALAWAIAQNPKCDQLFCAPGNAGIAQVAECVAIDPEDGDAVVAFCADESISFVVVGPEAPLALGVADTLRSAGILTFGPSREAAQLEASKAFTKEICDACGADTAAYGHFTDAEAAKDYTRQQGAPIVIKADGLAAGKGVVVAMDMETALAAIDDMFGGTFGVAGAEVVIEEFMEGEEASFFVLSDGVNVLPMGTAQDHKRAFDGDKGPNTGGMGAYSPAPVMTKEITQKALNETIIPTIKEMAKRGTPFQGVLYAGFMIKDGRPRLVEYNVRFGDPECQALMIRLGAQVLDVLLDCAEGNLADARVNWADDHALSIVYAAVGYPGAYEKSTEIAGLDGLSSGSSLHVFHAGTAAKDGKTLATGGRVLAITARGNNLKQAQDSAYKAIEKIDWPEGFYRKDIGWRAL